MHKFHRQPIPTTNAECARYDDALRKVYRKYRDWPSVIAAMELYLPDVSHVPDGHRPRDSEFKKHFLSRRPPLAYAMALVLAMEGEISLLDFCPYLEQFVTPRS